MKDIYIIKHYRKLTTSFRRNFTHTYVRSGMEDIHQLRVDIKKLRVILQLAERTSKKKYRKSEHFKLFASLFSMAGKVRELQVNSKLAHKYDNDNRLGLVSKLASATEITSLRLEKELSKFNFRKLNSLDKRLFACQHELKDKMVIYSSERFIKDQLSKIMRSVSEDCETGDLHSVRKRIRSVNETAGILIKIDKRSFPASTLTQLKALQEELGHWHDLVIFQEYLTKAFEVSELVNESSEFKNLVNELSADVDKASKEVCSKLNKCEVFEGAEICNE